MIRIAIMASGNGSNAQALIDKAQSLANIEIAAIISDHDKSYVVKRAELTKTPCIVAEKTGTQDEHEDIILNILKDLNIDWIFLAGYMRILSEDFVEKYPNKIINIHPSLLPFFPGKNSYEDAFEAKLPKSGITIHYVDEGVDSGEIIIQESFERLEEDTIEDFKARGLEVEHRLYPQILEWVNDGKL